MAHINIRHCVRGTVVSTDGTVLDSVEAELPAEDADDLGNEYSNSRQAEVDDSGAETGAEVVSFRVTFDSTSAGVTAAEDLYATLTGLDLSGADSYELVCYETPEGAVRADDVRQYYEENPDEQPTDQDGESYVPSSWDPANHIVAEEQA